MPMSSKKINIIWFFIGTFTLVSGTHSPIAWAQQAKKPFTVIDEIGLTLFGDPDGGAPSELYFSPDANYLAVWTERGRLDLNRPEDSLRFYRSQDIKNFLEHSDGLPVSPCPKAPSVRRRAHSPQRRDRARIRVDSRSASTVSAIRSSSACA